MRACFSAQAPAPCLRLQRRRVCSVLLASRFTNAPSSSGQPWCSGGQGRCRQGTAGTTRHGPMGRRRRASRHPRALSAGLPGSCNRAIASIGAEWLGQLDSPIAHHRRKPRIWNQCTRQAMLVLPAPAAKWNCSLRLLLPAPQTAAQHRWISPTSSAHLCTHPCQYFPTHPDTHPHTTPPRHSPAAGVR